MNVDQRKEFFRKSFTLKGRIFYPNILKPATTKHGKTQFNLMFAWKLADNQEVMKEVGNFLQTAKNTFHPSIPQQFWVNPVKKFDTYQRQDGKPNPAFLKDSYWVNASSGVDFPPVVVDQMRQPVIDEALVYSGRNAVVNIAFWLNDGDKKGLGTNVNAVMLLEGGDREGGSFTVNVDQIFGSFQADMGMPSQANNMFSQNFQQPQQQTTQQTQPAQNNNNPFAGNNNNGGGSFY